LADVRDVDSEGVQSESSDILFLSLKLGTVRMVEFMRDGFCGWGEAGTVWDVLPLTALPVVRGITALMTPSEASVSVGRDEADSASVVTIFGTVLGGLVVGKAACAAFVGTATSANDHG